MWTGNGIKELSDFQIDQNSWDESVGVLRGVEGTGSSVAGASSGKMPTRNPSIQSLGSSGSVQQMLRFHGDSTWNQC